MKAKVKAREQQERLKDKISSEIVLVCPDCRVQCFNIRMIKKSDGNFWTDDVCWRCGAQLPTVRIDHK